LNTVSNVKITLKRTFGLLFVGTVYFDHLLAYNSTNCTYRRLRCIECC